MQVVERQRPPEIAQEDGVWNIVATRDGLVTQVRALNGKALVAAGSTVTEGQLLVTGIYETRDQRTYTTHSLGTVVGRDLLVDEGLRRRTRLWVTAGSPLGPS